MFRGEVIERFREVAGGAGRLLELHEALVAGDAAAVEAELARILSTSPSVRDLLRENSYHMLMTGLLFGVPGYGDPRSNREEGRGYYDLRIAPEGQGGRPVLEDLPVITVELKVLGRSDAPQDGEALTARLAEVAREGLDQINRQRYDCEAPGGCLRYGVAFCGKDVAVACAWGQARGASVATGLLRRAFVALVEPLAGAQQRWVRQLRVREGGYHPAW